jgi:pimeloyl-ACP methyl ester carboxylesterase
MNRFLRWSLYALGGLLLLVLIGPFLIPIPPLEGTVPVQALADEDSRFVEVNGLQVHYKEDGQGEPTLILLHGFASSVFSWREVREPLAQYGRVVAFDRPAFGLTERPTRWQGANPYAADNQADLTVALMDRLGIEQAILVGNSAGGTVAARSALDHPDRVKALVLVDAAIYQGGGSPAWVRPLLNTPQARRIGPLLMRRIQNWGLDFARSAWHDPSKISEEVWEGYTKPLQAENWDRGLWELFASSRESDLASQLDQLNLPVLVISGDDDRIVDTQLSVRLAEHIPGAKLVIVPDCGHVPQEECPEAFLEAVEGFLAGLE